MSPTAELLVVTAKETTTHSGWEEATAHVSMAVPVRIGECLRFRQTREGVFILTGRPHKRNRGLPLAWITDPLSYKIAWGSGDLDDLPNFFRRRAEACLPGPAPFPVGALTAQGQAKPVSYVVLKNATPGVVWRTKVYPVGALVGIVTGNEAEEKKLGRYLAAGFLRVATADDKQVSAAPCITGATVRRPEFDEGWISGVPALRAARRAGRTLFPALPKSRFAAVPAAQGTG
ncbi:MAG: hypothetical protein INR62_03190 [Rhodospirillales bacterium]|nr:hypothetical protein [Acetobacter sp.]